MNTYCKSFHDVVIVVRLSVTAVSCFESTWWVPPSMKSWREAAVVAQDRCEWKSAGEDVLKALYGESCSAK